MKRYSAEQAKRFYEMGAKYTDVFDILDSADFTDRDAIMFACLGMQGADIDFTVKTFIRTYNQPPPPRQQHGIYVLRTMWLDDLQTNFPSDEPLVENGVYSLRGFVVGHDAHGEPIIYAVGSTRLQ